MTLVDAECGSQLKILSVADESCRAQLIRMGIGEGSVITCMEKLPMGPVVIKDKRQEIAIGRKLASKIFVEKSENPWN